MWRAPVSLAAAASGALALASPQSNGTSSYRSTSGSRLPFIALSPSVARCDAPKQPVQTAPVSAPQASSAAPAAVPKPLAASTEWVKEEVLGVSFPREVAVVTQAWQLPATHTLVSTAPRCMHDACWFSPARAYALGVYVEGAKIASLKRFYGEIETSPDARLLFDQAVDKTFRFAFVGDKDVYHICRGFERALTSCLPTEESVQFEYSQGLMEVRQLVGLLRKLSLHNGSVLSMTTVNEPAPGRTILMYAPSSTEQPAVVGVVEGGGLRQALHRLYLERDGRGSFRYRALSEKLEADAKKAVK